MDVDVTVADIRRLLKQVDQGDPADLAYLAELVDALFGWLDKGGHLPACWGE